MPRADRLLLIMPASFKRWPSELVFFARSEPARSIIWKREDFICQMPFTLRILLSICVVRTECERELSLFIKVDPTCRFLAPRVIR